MFERLLNLDVEIRCLATRAYVFKQELTNDLFYRTSDESEDVEDGVDENNPQKHFDEETRQLDSEASKQEYYVPKIGFMNMKDSAKAVVPVKTGDMSNVHTCITHR